MKNLCEGLATLPALWVFRVKGSNCAILFQIGATVAKLSNNDFSHMMKMAGRKEVENASGKTKEKDVFIVKESSGLIIF